MVQRENVKRSADAMINACCGFYDYVLNSGFYVLAPGFLSTAGDYSTPFTERLDNDMGFQCICLGRGIGRVRV